MWLSSTNCYFITEYKNAKHCLFQSRKKWLFSTQSSFLSPCLPTSHSLPTNFFVEQSLTTSILMKHLPFSLPPKDHHTALRTTLHSLLLHNQSLCIHVSLFTQYHLERATCIWNILYSYSNTEAIINHSTSMNKRIREIVPIKKRKQNKTKRMLRNKNTHNSIALFSKPVALKTAAYWIHAVSCGARHQAFEAQQFSPLFMSHLGMPLHCMVITGPKHTQLG